MIPFSTRLVPLWLVLALPACAPAGERSGAEAADPPPAGAPDPATDWQPHAARLTAADLAARFVEASALFLDTAYEGGPLGEGPGAVPDPDPRVDLTRVDCVTYLEQSLALALASPEVEASFLEALDAIRYEGGRVDFARRNHYMITDWLPANEWLVEDVTARLAPDHVRTVTRTIDRAKFLEDQGAPAAVPPAPETRELTYVPSSALTEADPAIRAGDLVLWVGSLESLFILHTGLAVRAADGELLFRHGSSKAGRVLDESFADYAAGKKFLGFVVWRVREDARLPESG